MHSETCTCDFHCRKDFLLRKVVFVDRICTFPSYESKDTDSNSSSEESSELTLLTPFRGRLFLPEVRLHISAIWFGLLHALHNFPNAGHLVRCLTWLLPQCLQRFKRSSLGSGSGCFCIWPLLRRFGGAFYFLRLATALALSAGIPELDDCPMSAGGFGWSTDIQTLFKR